MTCPGRKSCDSSGSSAEQEAKSSLGRKGLGRVHGDRERARDARMEMDMEAALAGVAAAEAACIEVEDTPEKRERERAAQVCSSTWVK